MTPEEELLLLQQIGTAGGNGASLDATTMPIGTFDIPPPEPTLLDSFREDLSGMLDPQAWKDTAGVVGTSVIDPLLGDGSYQQMFGNKPLMPEDQSLAETMGASANRVLTMPLRATEDMGEGLEKAVNSIDMPDVNLREDAQNFASGLTGGLINPYTGEATPPPTSTTAPTPDLSLDQTQANSAVDAEIATKVEEVQTIAKNEFEKGDVGTSDRIYKMLKGVTSATGNALSLSADAWNGLSTSTKVGIIGSAMTLYMKSQGWNNSAATGAQMTAQGYMSALGQQDQLASNERIAGARDKATTQAAAIKAQQAAIEDAKGKETLSKVADLKDLREVISPALDNSDLFKGDWNPTTNEEAMKADMVNQVGALYAKQFPYIEDQRQNPMTPDLARSLAAQIQAQQGAK